MDRSDAGPDCVTCGDVASDKKHAITQGDHGLHMHDAPPTMDRSRTDCLTWGDVVSKAKQPMTASDHELYIQDTPSTMDGSS